MNDRPDWVAVPDRPAERPGWQGCGHPVPGRVADDLLREHVEYRGQMELAFSGGMLRDVRQPEQVRGGSGEVALDEFIVNGRASPLARAGLADNDGADPVLVDVIGQLSKEGSREPSGYLPSCGLMWRSTIPRARSREVGRQSERLSIHASSHSPTGTLDLDGSMYTPRLLSISVFARKSSASRLVLKPRFCVWR